MLEFWQYLMTVPDDIHSSLHSVLIKYISSTRTSVYLQDMMSRSFPCWHASRACKINLVSASSWFAFSDGTSRPDYVFASFMSSKPPLVPISNPGY